MKEVNEEELKRMLYIDKDVTTVDISSINDMRYMFNCNATFNQKIGVWDVSNVYSMYMMFNEATAFNEDIRNWKTGNVKSMGGMFYDAKAFNQDISKWDVINVNDMAGMFCGATEFINGPYFDRIMIIWAMKKGLPVELLIDMVTTRINK